MNKLDIFKLEIIEQREVLGKDFKIYGDFENPLFLAKDVAEWIEHNKPSEMIRNIDEDEKIKLLIDPSDNIARVFQANTEYWFLTENGLYEVLMQSRKPIAKQFKKQVKEILKSIRKHGGYLTPQKIEDILLNPDTLIQLATNLKQEQEKNKLLNIKLIEQAPKVLFAESVETSKTTILIGELAKILKQNGLEDIGQNKLFQRLRQEGYLIKTGSSQNMPTQKSMQLGLFEIKETVRNNPDGSIRIHKTTKVTGKGQVYFINKYCAKRKEVIL